MSKHQQGKFCNLLHLQDHCIVQADNSNRLEIQLVSKCRVGIENKYLYLIHLVDLIYYIDLQYKEYIPMIHTGNWSNGLLGNLDIRFHFQMNIYLDYKIGKLNDPCDWCCFQNETFPQDKEGILLLVLFFLDKNRVDKIDNHSQLGLFHLSIQNKTKY